MTARKLPKGGMSPAEKEAMRVIDALSERNLLMRVQEECAERHVLIGDVVAKARIGKSVTTARHAIWRILHDEKGLSWPEVARIFGRTHDSIMHATEYRESRSRKALEDSVAKRIAAWMRSLGPQHDPYELQPVATAIERGDWRETKLH